MNLIFACFDLAVRLEDRASDGLALKLLYGERGRDAITATRVGGVGGWVTRCPPCGLKTPLDRNARLHGLQHVPTLCKSLPARHAVPTLSPQLATLTCIPPEN